MLFITQKTSMYKKLIKIIFILKKDKDFETIFSYVRTAY